MRKSVLGVWVLLASASFAAEYFVSPTGNNANAGTSESLAWKTLQYAAGKVNPGDVVTVLPGQYAGFHLTKDGTANARITFRAKDSAFAPNPAVVIDQNNGTTIDRINLEGASYVTIEGFTVIGSGDPATNRACIRSVLAQFVTIRNNRCDLGGRWGIFTGFVDDLLIERNETSRSADEHGIYVSNSGDRPVIRDNASWGNHSNGIHMNGDLSQGGDGVISDAIVERNVIYENGNGNPIFGAPGGSGINCDGVRDSVIRNNLLYRNHKSGISLYRIDGGDGSKNNVVVHNTVWNASDARWCLNIQDGSTGNHVRNNILFNDHPTRGAIDISISSLPGFVSNHNVVKDKFGIDGVFLTFAQWKAQTGQDGNSTVSTPVVTFANAAANDLDLAATSPARDTGTTMEAASDDVRGKPRPYGAGYDRGAYESGSCHSFFTTAGNPVPGSGGITPTLAATGCADVADSFSLAITPSLAGAQGILFFGTTPAQIAFYGGVLELAPIVVFALSGAAGFPLAIPADPGLVGSSIRFQYANLDPGAPAGVALSKAQVAVLGG
jgi:hypothetical protein